MGIRKKAQRIQPTRGRFLRLLHEPFHFGRFGRTDGIQAVRPTPTRTWISEAAELTFAGDEIQCVSTGKYPGADDAWQTAKVSLFLGVASGLRELQIPKMGD